MPKFVEVEMVQREFALLFWTIDDVEIVSFILYRNNSRQVVRIVEVDLDEDFSMVSKE